MNTNEINRLLRGRCRGAFLGVFASDRLPARLPHKRPVLMVCNTDRHDQVGRHWVVIYVGTDSRGEYFDSLNQPPPQTFLNYLNKNCNSWSWNPRQLQSLASHFCGNYCVYFSLFRCLGYSMNAIDSCFSTDYGLNDVFVHGIVCRLL